MTRHEYRGRYVSFRQIYKRSDVIPKVTFRSCTTKDFALSQLLNLGQFMNIIRHF